MNRDKGFVAFVGAGPGDVGLITQKGIDHLKKADVVLYDRLANPRLLRYTKDNCQFIYCGKLPDKHIMRQENINESLVEHALKGLYVVRLKGGDPSVFGRVGEEAEALKNEKIKYEIVPGITASIAASIYAGIPVTHRDYCTSFTIRTGHKSEKNVKNENQTDSAGETIAYYMGVKGLPSICEQLVREGKPLSTKVAVIQWGTHGKQKTVEGTLETIHQLVQQEKITNPALTIVGEVISLRSSLKWFEDKPFYQKRILIAKSTSEPNHLENYFSQNGAEAYSFPSYQMKVTPFSKEDMAAVKRSKRIVFASPESVGLLFDALLQYGYDVRDLPYRIEYLSDKTKKVLEQKGIRGEKASFCKEDTVIIGRDNNDSLQKFADNYLFLSSHRVEIDHRFNEINKRLLLEDNWETVVFPNKQAVDSFLIEYDRVIGQTVKSFKFAFIGSTVKQYAIEKGFSEIDEQVQAALEQGEWKTIL